MWLINNTRFFWFTAALISFANQYTPQCLDISSDTSPNIKVNTDFLFNICSLETAIPISIQNNVSELLPNLSAQNVKQKLIKSTYVSTF